MKAAVGLADLARLFHVLPAEQRAEHAAWLGFHRHDPPAQADETQGGSVLVEHGAGSTAISSTAASTQESLAERETGMRFWRLEAAIDREPSTTTEEPPGPGLTWADLESPGCSLSSVPLSPPLSPWPALWTRLRSALHGSLASREPDVAALVRAWARGTWAKRLPRLMRRTWAAAATIWIDRSARLVPFWSDQDAVCLHLERLCGASALDVRNLDGNLQAVTWERHGDLVGRRRLDPTAPLLVLGDLGCYGSDRDRARWVATARRLWRYGIRVAALVPCSPQDPRWDRDLARTWNATPWERSAIRNDELTRDERAQRLLRLIAPTFLAQPGLVRALRQLLPAADADASTEVDAWHHRDVSAADVTGLVLDAAALKRLRAEFTQLAPALQAEVRTLIEAWHRDLPPELLHAETLAWWSWNQTKAPGDVERAKAFARRVAVTAWTVGGEDEAPGLARDYGLHLLSAMDDTLYAKEPALKKLWSVARMHLPGEQRPETIAAHEAVTPGERPVARWWALHQQGDALIVVRVTTGAWSTGCGPGSPVAMFKAADPSVWVRRDNETRPLPLEEGATISRQPGERLVLDTDQGNEVTLEVWARAPWAAAAGRDRYGLWAAFEVEGVQQRMRWIPPGRFLMGSPPTEAGRYEGEGPQHWVTITKGYWLGETPVTQALWRAVMKSNPSYFKSDDRPVEQVSWDDCQQFITRLNRSLEDFETRLPTEAEWERACRAGTTAATWVGDLTLRGEYDAPELDTIAWYGGNSGVGFDLDNGYDSSGWPEKQHPDTPAGTHPVGRLQANPYGLHDMLGNVYEWCQGALYPYASESAEDPMPPDQGSYRVTRGGSWLSYARLVRAAHRSASPRGLADDFLGFRLAGGQVSAPSTQAREPRSGDLGRGAGRDTSRASERDATPRRRKFAGPKLPKPPKPAKKRGG